MSEVFVPAWGWVGSLDSTKLNQREFSSPSGDGLVPNNVWVHKKTKFIFVPEWGLVGSFLRRFIFLLFRRFSSPLGDGLVHRDKMRSCCCKYIFVPEWGWVGSLGVGIHPRLLSFSSPLGDGLVQSLLYHPKACFSFSSPSGVELVLAKLLSNSNFGSVFVPSGGLVVRC